MRLALREWNDQATWDAFVASQRTCHYNQGWAWGEAAGPLGGRCYRVAVVETPNSDPGDRNPGATQEPIRAAMSVVASPIRHTSFSQLHVSRGPAADNPTPEVMDLLTRRLAEIAREERALGSKIEPHVEAGSPAWIGLLRREGFAPLYPPSQPRSTWVLDLRPEPDELLAAMKPKWRYNIRLAQKKGVEIVSGTEADLDPFYRVYQETSRRDNFYIHPREVYGHIFREFRRLGQLELLLARYQGEVIAAASLVHLGDTVWYLYGASTDRNREVMAPHLIQWAAIQWARSRGAERYDFRGVPDVPAPGQELYGVYRFKQGFGGRQVTFLETFAKGHQRPLFDLWRTYWQGRFLAQVAKRRFRGLPQRQWA